jgi:hypothetical protein
MKQFDHIGIPTDEPKEGESWVETSQVWVTNPRTHPQRIEYIRHKVKPDVPKTDLKRWKLANLPHVAYRVNNLESAIAGEEVIYGPFDPAGFGRAVFIHKDGVIIEFIEYSSLDVWFDQKTPWKPAGE